MKKFFIVLALLLSLILTSSSSAVVTMFHNKEVDTSRSVVRTGPGLIYSGYGIFYGIIIKTDGMNDVKINVYDANATTPKTIKLIPKDTLVTGPDFQFGFPIHFYPGIMFNNGLLVDVSCSGTYSYQILYFPWK